MIPLAPVLQQTACGTTRILINYPQKTILLGRKWPQQAIVALSPASMGNIMLYLQIR